MQEAKGLRSHGKLAVRKRLNGGRRGHASVTARCHNVWTSRSSATGSSAALSRAEPLPFRSLRIVQYLIGRAYTIFAGTVKSEHRFRAAVGRSGRGGLVAAARVTSPA
jgi:hypothetical protein